MLAGNIRDLLHREPFVRFRLVLSSDVPYDITSTEFVVALKSEVFLVFDYGQRWAHVPLLHIPAIDTTRGENSRKPRKRKQG